MDPACLEYCLTDPERDEFEQNGVILRLQLPLASPPRRHDGGALDRPGILWADDPIRAQLLGASPSGGHGYTSPAEEDVPLKGWIGEHLGPEAVAP